MRTGATKPEWDTPPDGDFASYVQRLTATPPPAATRTNLPAAAPGGLGATSGARPPLRQGDSLPPSRFALGWAPLDAGLRTARAVVLGLTALHAVALVVFAQGSLVGLIAMSALWWGLGALRAQLRRAMESTNSGEAPLALHDIQERLRALALQRATGDGPAKGMRPDKRTDKRSDKRKT